MYWENIEGYFNFQNIYTGVVQSYPSGSTFVEIGAYKGKSAVYMAEEIIKSKKDITFWAVDTFEGTKDEQHDEDFFEEFLANIEPVKMNIKFHKEDSKQAYKRYEDNSIDFLFIDGDHTYKGVKADLTNWYPKVKQGGIIAGHDYAEPTCGVKMAVDQYFLFTGIIQNGTSWIVKK